MNKSLYFDFINTIEKTAISVYPYIGSGDKNKIDEVATFNMRNQLNKIDFSGEINLSEGIKDSAPTFDINEKVGMKKEENIEYSLVIDPVDGTGQTAKDGNSAMSIIAVSEKDSFLCSNAFYMCKFSINIKLKQEQLNKIILDIFKDNNFCSLLNVIDKNDYKFIILDRPRHKKLIDELRKNNLKIKLIQDCDIDATMLSNVFKDNYVYLGIGGYTEGLLSASIQKCSNGEFSALLCNDKYEIDFSKVYSSNELVKKNVFVVASGILNGNILNKIEFKKNKFIVNTLFLSSYDKFFKYLNSYYE